MVSSAEVTADFFEAVFCEVSRQVHTDLSGQRDALASFFALQVGQADVKIIGYDTYNFGDGYTSPCDEVITAEGLSAPSRGGSRKAAGFPAPGPPLQPRRNGRRKAIAHGPTHWPQRTD